MKKFDLRFVLFPALAFFVGMLLFPVDSNAQRRDFLTDAEIELVRDAQDIDTRIEVLTKAIDRRFAVLNVNVPGATPPQKESDKWGELPKGSRLDLLTDIKKLLQKAIDDIDDVAIHKTDTPQKTNRSGDELTAKQQKKEAQRFPNAVRNLAAAAGRYIPALKASLDKTNDQKEKGPILDSIEFCNQIIEAVGQLPAAVKNEKNK